MQWEALVAALEGVLRQHGLLRPRLHWVLGVSGGPDSTVLAHALVALNAQASLEWTLHAAHFHHGLRGAEADADEAYVRALAERLGLSYHVEQVDLPRQIREQGGSTEEVARQARYEFLERIALRTGSDLVAVAHHADDNAETVLHRICRGTGLRGLGGMSVLRAIREGSRVQVVRPLLGLRRADIEAIAAARGFEPRLDSTNHSPDFTRARIRHQVLPHLRETLNPNVTDAILRLAEQARWMSEYLADAADRVFDSLVIEAGPRRVVLNRLGLAGKQRIIQAEVVRRAVSLVVGHEQELSFTHFEAVLRLAEDEGSGKEVHLPGPVLVRRHYNRLDIRPLDEREQPVELESLHVHCPGETSLTPLGFELLAAVEPITPAKIEELRRTPHPLEEWLDVDRLRLPLFVRGRRDGDRFHPLGAPGAKSISDFLMAEKVDPPVRARTGVLCDQDGPIWVMPLRIDERAKLRPTTQRALRLRLRPLGKGGLA